MDYLRFVYLDPFPRLWTALGLTDDELRLLEIAIMKSPDRSPVIPGANGIRKLRFAKPGLNKGKSGSFRIFYVHFPHYGQVIVLAVIAKHQEANLPRSNIVQFGHVVQEIRELLDKGVIK